MKKNGTKKEKDLNFSELDKEASRNPKSLEEIRSVSKKPTAKAINCFSKIGDDGKSLILRIPAQIKNDFHIEKGQYMHFYAELDDGKIGELKISFKEDKNNASSN